MAVPVPLPVGRWFLRGPVQMGRGQGTASIRSLVPCRQCMAGAQVPGGPGTNALEELPVAFSTKEWQRCVLCSPPPDAILPLVGEAPAAFHPPAWPEDLLDPPPPDHGSKRGDISREFQCLGLRRNRPPPPVPTTPPVPPAGCGFISVDSSESSDSEDGGGRAGAPWRAIARLRPGLGACPRPLATRSKFRWRRREGGSTGIRSAKRLVLGFKAGGRSTGVVDGAIRRRTRAASALVAVGAAEEGGGLDAVGVGVAGAVGVA